MSIDAFSRLALLGATAWLAGCGMFMPIPADLDYATVRTSDQGAYRLTYISDTHPVPISRLHSWKLHVETADGRPVEGATIVIDGDMPQHGHGLPTRPAVTQALGNGDYRVDGMKFQMGGWWQIYVDVTADGRHDKATFNLRLE